MKSIVKGCKVRSKIRHNPQESDPFDGVIELVSVPYMADCALVKWPGASEGLCFPRRHLEVEP